MADLPKTGLPYLIVTADLELSPYILQVHEDRWEAMREAREIRACVVLGDYFVYNAPGVEPICGQITSVHWGPIYTSKEPAYIDHRKLVQFMKDVREGEIMPHERLPVPAWQTVIQWDNGTVLAEVYNENADTAAGAEVLALRWFDEHPAEAGVTHTAYIYKGLLREYAPDDWTFSPNISQPPRVLDRPQ